MESRNFGRFAGAQRLPGPAMGVSPELHLMGLAQ